MTKTLKYWQYWKVVGEKVSIWRIFSNLLKKMLYDYLYKIFFILHIIILIREFKKKVSFLEGVIYQCMVLVVMVLSSIIYTMRRKSIIKLFMAEFLIINRKLWEKGSLKAEHIYIFCSLNAPYFFIIFLFQFKFSPKSNHRVVSGQLGNSNTQHWA